MRTDLWERGIKKRLTAACGVELPRRLRVKATLPRDAYKWQEDGKNYIEGEQGSPKPGTESASAG
jgi:hypothetical protein